jgi:hypothetical protein
LNETNPFDGSEDGSADRRTTHFGGWNIGRLLRHLGSYAY